MAHQIITSHDHTVSRSRCSIMITTLRRKLSRVCSRIRWLVRRRRRLRLTVIVRALRKRKRSHTQSAISQTPIRIATFNVAMFSLAPALPNPKNNRTTTAVSYDFGAVGEGAGREAVAELQPPIRSILKQSPLHTQKLTRSKLKVSINLPDNEISLANNKLVSSVVEGDEEERGTSPMLFTRSKVPVRSPICSFPYMMGSWNNYCSNGREDDIIGNKSSILEVLMEVNADILALQDVKAEEEKGMWPLSDLARALGMHYVFAESWAPQYGNAVLSRWPIKRWRVQKIADDDDFRNVLKATIQVPWAGELNFSCTQLDHLDEYWRMRQIRAIVGQGQGQSSPHHILAGGLNSLHDTDYSTERWADIVKYYEDIGKPKPKVEVMKFLNGKQYVDAKHFAADCEPVVIIAKGQNVQGTCKYGTRVDYVLASPYSPFMFVPNSYSVISSKGTSDHHIVKVDVVRVVDDNDGNKKDIGARTTRPRQQPRHKVRTSRHQCSYATSSCLAAAKQQFQNFPSVL